MIHPVTAVSSRRISLLLLAPLLLVSGCGGGATISGVVKVGGQPIERGKITFLPQEDEKGAVVSGDILSGKYTLHEVPLGKKRVDIDIIDTDIYRKALS